LKTSLFITFEGVEGCGKSTQSRRIYRRLERLAIPALLIHEPGITALGKKITRHKILKFRPCPNCFYLTPPAPSCWRKSSFPL
jgi:thymidylate kinase